MHYVAKFFKIVYFCFLDIAIGAPNEDDGAGAVYIFNGKSGQMNSVYSQRISAKVLFAGIKSFGTSITLPMDVDNNQYNGEYRK